MLGKAGRAETSTDPAPLLDDGDDRRPAQAGSRSGGEAALLLRLGARVAEGRGPARASGPTGSRSRSWSRRWTEALQLPGARPTPGPCRSRTASTCSPPACARRSGSRSSAPTSPRSSGSATQLEPILRARARHAQRLRRARRRRLLRRLRPEARRARPLRADAWRAVQDVIMSAVGGENVTTTDRGPGALPGQRPLPARAARRPRQPRARARHDPVRGADPARPARQIRMVTGPVDDPQRERPARRLRLRRHRRPRHRRLRRGRQAGGRRGRDSSPPGYSLEWSGQYENMLRVRRAAEARGARHALPDLLPALREHAVGASRRGS